MIVVVSPGVGVLYTLAAGLSQGPRASIVAAFGCTLGILPHIAAALAGLAAIFYASAVAFQTLKYLGVAYLLVLAWRTLREKGALMPDEDTIGRTNRQVIVSGVLVNIFSALNHIRLVRRIRQGSDNVDHASSLGVSMAVLLGVVGVSMAIYLISIR